MNGLYAILGQYLNQSPQGMTGWNDFIASRYPNPSRRDQRFLTGLQRQGLYGGTIPQVSGRRPFGGGGAAPAATPSLTNYSPTIPDAALKQVDVGLQGALLSLAQGGTLPKGKRR